jgi:hypothetical protein
MTLIKGFWIVLGCLVIIGIVTLGLVGIPAKPTTIQKTIPNDRLPQ